MKRFSTPCTSRYRPVNCLDCSVPVRGKVIRTVLAEGRSLYGVVEEDDGSKVKGIVLSRPLVVVAAWLICFRASSGRRKVLVQPAPRMSTSTGGGEDTGVSVMRETVNGAQSVRWASREWLISVDYFDTVREGEASQNQ